MIEFTFSTFIGSENLCSVIFDEDEGTFMKLINLEKQNLAYQTIRAVIFFERRT